MDDFTPVETHHAVYFGCAVEVWRIKGPNWSCSPWRFAVTHDDNRRRYVGVPNYCDTKAQALKRAWYRAKWLADGSHSRRYG
jgi:hypothetical protein